MVLADYLQNASGSSTPICDFAAPFTANTISKRTQAGATIFNDAGKNAVNEQNGTEATVDVQCEGMESTKTQNEVRNDDEIDKRFQILANF